MKTTLALLSLVLGASACAPNTIIRRTAFIPAATAPARVGLPMDKGAVRVEGHINALNMQDTIDDGDWLGDAFPNVGDPGVLIPDVHLGASVWFGLPVGLELGFQFGYASMEWSHRNAVGVMDFPDGEERDLFMGGVGMRFNFPIRSDVLSLSLMGQLDLVSVPEAVFICIDEDHCTSDQFSSGLEAEEIYRFDHIDDELFILPQLALQLGWKALPNLMPYVFLGVQGSVTNTGFEDDPTTLPDDSLESMVVGTFGIGIDADIDGFVIGGSFYIPFEGEERIDFGPSFAFKIGGRFGGTPKPERREVYEPEGEYAPPPDRNEDRYDYE